ncbi:MAG TPA: UDP binding domain-containing protein, partial [Stellaceae bacterium]|nr:UDP binding domain-containing protein [Stellaceae bacterium]
SYKADIDDLRESPALHIVEMLARDNAGELLIVEPNIRRLPESLTQYPCLRATDLQTAVLNADIIVLLVDHRQFKRVDRELLNIKIVIDTRGIWR